MEKWLDIKGYPNRQVSDLGRIRSVRKSGYNIRNPKPDKRGYVRMQLKYNGQTVRVHRIVAKAFIPNPLNLPEVNHINGIRHDNRVENLEWVTKSENQLHARRTGLMPETPKGQDHWNAVLNDKMVISIKTLLKEGLNPRQIADKMNINKSTVTNIKYGLAWSHIKIC